MKTPSNQQRISRLRSGLAVLIATASIAVGGPTMLNADEAQAAGVVTHHYANIHNINASE